MNARSSRSSIRRKRRGLSARRALIGAAAMLATVGCRNDELQVVPNRVLDRPLDMALTCVQLRTDGSVEVLSLNGCNDAFPDSCTSAGPQLVGFVANSERNEVAVFRRCDREQAVVDLDVDAPGHQLIPVGTLPSRLARTVDSCRVVSANVGSCDLSVLDTVGLASLALGVTGEEPASGLVSAVVPRRADGTPLGAAPGDIVPVPNTLSQAAGVSTNDDDDDDDGDDDGDDGVGGDDAGDDGGTTGELGDGTGGTVESLACSPEVTGSVYVTFPACQLVAELDLATGVVLQSRQLSHEVRDGTNVVVVEDTGVDPQCPVECPGVFDGDLPAAEPVDPDGMFPGTLALVVPPRDTDDPDESDLRVNYSALFVAGTGSDHVVEFEISEDGVFSAVEEPPQLELQDAQGIQALRPTPSALVNGEDHQFVYAIAGDGSTHVVDRDYDLGDLGVECDTQVDPTQVAVSACHALEAGTVGTAPDRRALVSGPGIRAERGAAITDWTFFKVDDNGITQDGDPVVTPFAQSGLVGVGVTSFGLITFVSFGQLQGASVEALDPLGLMNTEVRPHALWPLIDPQTEEVEVLPRVLDEDPSRGFGGPDSDTRVLAPALRRIDLAYSVPSQTAAQGDTEADLDSISEAQSSISAALYTAGADEEPGQGGFTFNEDRLGQFDDKEVVSQSDRLYENSPARVVVRDYTQWRTQSWALEWEGAIPGSGSGTGLLQCDDHGGVDSDGNAFSGGTCRSSTAGDVRLFDESANLCDEGVLPGDKLVLGGCIDDEGCGLGQRCLQAATGPASATGICISSAEYDENLEELRRTCAPFISDPCGVPIREYRVTRAFQDEVWIQAMDVPERAILREVDGELQEWSARLSCAAPVPHRDQEACTADSQCQEDAYAPGDPATAYFCDIPENGSEGSCELLADSECLVDEDCDELGRAYLCVDEVCRAPCDLCAPDDPDPSNTCTVDADCTTEAGDGGTCFGGVCHQPCTDDSPGCMQSPLPGPRCFPEFVSYSVRLKDAFKIEAPGSTPFFTDAVSADPATGECIEDPSASNLLTSRLRLGADEAETFGHPVWGIPDCPSALQAGPADPNPCRITGSRGDPGNSLFHWFAYDGAQVQAVRFTNPFMSVVLDLTSLLDIASPEVESELPWPTSMGEFNRGRIPRGYRQEFAGVDGYRPYDEPVVVGRNRLVYPVRVVAAPEAGVVYVVDAGSQGGLSPRGQVMRIVLTDSQVQADQQFRVQ